MEMFNICPGCQFNRIFVLHFILVLCCCVSESSQGDHPVPYALSPVYLEYLENVEARFYNLLKSNRLAGVDDEHQAIVKKYLAEYEGSVQKLRKNHTTSDNHERSVPEPWKSLAYDNELSSNPILSLQMINRFVKYFKKSNIYTTISEEIIEEDALPNGKAVEDAMEALLRLQYIYDLDAEDLSNGILHGTQTKAHLTARECYELGKFAQESAYFTLALQWFDVTLRRVQKGEYDKDPSLAHIKKDSIMKAIRDTIQEHNEDFDENIVDGDMYSFSSPVYSTNYSTIAHLSLRKRLADQLTGQIFEETDPKYFQAIEANMMALCDGKNLQPEKTKAKLKCVLDTSRNPYWRINPLKIEVLNESPKILQIYNIFSNTWIEYLKEMSYTELERAPQPPEATPRTAAYAWFEDTAIPEIPVSRRVELITGLNVRGTRAAESLQIAAYAFGGHVEAHYDSRGPNDPEFNTRGDRVTTFLVYLSEVEQGGLTAFPLLGISIKPVKNSAVLWYTNLKNGEIDDWTLHAACPVIKGQKWIATKWTHINENIFKYPCGLNPKE